MNDTLREWLFWGSTIISMVLLVYVGGIAPLRRACEKRGQSYLEWKQSERAKTEDAWIPVDQRMPQEHVDVHIRLKHNPHHNPGEVVWDSRLKLWCGYALNYRPTEVSHWRPSSY